MKWKGVWEGAILGRRKGKTDCMELGQSSRLLLMLSLPVSQKAQELVFRCR